MKSWSGQKSSRVDGSVFAVEKQKSRDADYALVASGRKTFEQVRAENAPFAQLETVFDFSQVEY